MTAAEIARLLDAELQGGADPEITGAAPLERAGPDDLSIVARPRYLPYVEASRAGLYLVASAVADRVPQDRARIVVEDVHAGLAVILPRLYPEPEPEPGIHATAVVDADAELGRDVVVGPGAVIDAGARVGDRTRIGAHAVVGPGCHVGADARLHPHVTLYAGTRLGNHSIVHSGTRLGVDGFGYAEVDGVPRKVPQVGACVIGSHVEIGANVTIDRGSIGDTEIGDHVKIDNLVQIGHNVRIGAGSIIVAQVGISGSVRVGPGATLAGQAGIGGHLEIGAGATIAAQAGVFGDIPAGETWSGYPARPHAEALRAQANLFRLPKLLKRVRELEREIEGQKGQKGGE
ncbi:MAG: UDP-3-O-(3-hydroxymyristoyl)glucosamine N-acyltransferase, partial [Gemmatimonadetes bacterium]|nr:UDP-3-O-(3-hydroxymyristoyl)glucosamine N-acyltransferase [Gemmatimonadota bacterium]NIQ54056.1 UDP-3-O-(3-hydroxymyristoyl)glucosamine N-acyltransferase [Gemmatimonadota bacterium]NIU74244.1 UDP-3-O-(3-hydroxymyristoyl)glucosamine N-acyltransferase [Gammaproteobacteria bacterium]NIX44266.1 UDP-3-O-(3-hydroxymyristoyl)glucosamine N-acyltransferase [Gemmatimonadota bacterium]NIY08480.1 UDP-3-O-(3-hydroxymyristoyl)glucosamine N-acyltransferase [Gemmatimonadota bacterium]